MGIPLIVSIVIAVVCVIVMIAGYLDEGTDSFHFALGIIVLSIDVVFGFGLISCLVPAQNSPIKYYEAEEVFNGEKYLVAALDNKVWFTGEKRFIDRAKEGIVRIGSFNELNSYGGKLGERSSIYVFTKEEWDKMSLITLEKPDGGQNETQDNGTKGN